MDLISSCCGRGFWRSSGSRLDEKDDILILRECRQTFTYDAANQLETSVDGTGTTTYTYDDAGNLSVASAPGGSRTTYSWDDENRNTRIALPDSSLVTMSYRFDGLRYEKQTGTATERFIYDGQNYLVITDGAGAAQNVSNNEPQEHGNLISQQFLFGGAVWLPIYFHFDALGSTRQIVSESDALVNQYAYTAWGEALAALTSETVFSAFRWVGQLGYYFDQESGSYYVRARRYGPEIERWLSQDPLGFEGSGWNMFEYVSSLPTADVDPEGLQKQSRLVRFLGNLFSLGFSYGKYCGFDERSLTAKPDDSLDRACQDHDSCIGPDLIRGLCRAIRCNAQLCTDAFIARRNGCAADYPGNASKRNACRRAVRLVQLWACTAERNRQRQASFRLG